MKPARPTLAPCGLALLLAAGCTLEFHEVGLADAAEPDAEDRTDCGCADGELCCDETCVDPDTSPTHCGACDVVCGTHGQCVLGQCVCDPEYAWCPGGCTRLDSDRENCGACGAACAVGQSCRRGACL